MLLLWANEQEIEAVLQLLVKLGELPPQGGNPDKFRVLNTIAPEDAAEFLEKLRRAWPSLLPNELNLPDLPQTEETMPDQRKAGRPSPPSSGEAQEVRSTRSQLRPPLLEVALLSPDDGPGSFEGEPASPPPPASPAPQANAPESPGVPVEPSNEEMLRRFFSQRKKNQAAATPPPINLSFAPDGSLVISSEDTDALDVLEELISQTAPALPDYKIYKLKYADAYWVMDNIEEFFKEDEEEKNNRVFDRFGRYDFPPPQQQSAARGRLSQRRKLKFIYDLDTNSILVQGADSRQLKTIEELIQVYDQPEPASSQSARVSQAIPIRFSKATIVAEAIKDVYRDLLSSNDKALQSNNPEKKARESRDATFIFGGAGEEEPERTQVKFKGKLSIGIDAVSNTLLVSAEGENLMQNVSEMIKTLDEAARPLSSFSIVHLQGNTNAARVREVLSTLLSDGPSTANPAPARNANAPQNGPDRQRSQAQEESQAGAVISAVPQ